MAGRDMTRFPPEVWAHILALRPRDRDARSPTACCITPLLDYHGSNLIQRMVSRFFDEDTISFIVWPLGVPGHFYLKSRQERNMERMLRINRFQRLYAEDMPPYKEAIILPDDFDPPTVIRTTSSLSGVRFRVRCHRRSLDFMYTGDDEWMNYVHPSGSPDFD